LSARLEGVGVGLVEVPRLERALERFGARLESRLFTAEERAYGNAAARPAQRLAGRLAAKLALRDALGPPAPAFSQVEVLRDAQGAPSLRWSAGPDIAARVSMTHESQLAVATVWLES
jgi:holo-[acyl-carrier protein] synthase